MMKKVNNREEAERLADEIMAAFGKELGEARADFCEALMDPAEEVMSFAEWKKMQSGTDRETAEVRPAGGRRRMRRVVILAAVLILVMALAMVAAEGVKLKKSTLYMKDDVGESTRIIDISKAEFDVENFVVSYVPEGYELVEDEVVSKGVRKIKYEDAQSRGIKIHITKTSVFGANVDNEKAGSTEVLVNDKQAYIFYDDKTGFIVWQMGDCTIDVSARLGEEELIQLANKIYVD